MREGGTWSLSNLRFSLILLSFVALLGMALGAKTLFYRTHVRAPLTSAFEQIPGVDAAKIVAQGDATDVVIHLHGDLDLPATYAQIEQAALSGLGDELGRITIKDDRTPELQEDFYNLSFALQEGVATGQFVRMHEQIQTAVSTMALSGHRVAVGDDFVYVELHKDGHSLYAVVPRPPAGQEQLGGGPRT